MAEDLFSLTLRAVKDNGCYQPKVMDLPSGIETYRCRTVTTQEYSTVLQRLARDSRFVTAGIKAYRGSGKDLAAILHLGGGKRVVFKTPEEFQRWHREQK